MLSSGACTSTSHFPDPCILLIGLASYMGLWFRVYTLSEVWCPSSEGIISKLMPLSCIQKAVAHPLDEQLLGGVICDRNSGSHGHVHTAIPPSIQAITWVWGNVCQDSIPVAQVPHKHCWAKIVWVGKVNPYWKMCQFLSRGITRWKVPCNKLSIKELMGLFKRWSRIGSSLLVFFGSRPDSQQWQ